MTAMNEPRTLIFDNGGYKSKIGYSTQKEPSVSYNIVFKSHSDKKRKFVGDEVAECKDKSKLYYMMPFDRGYLVNWETEFEVWDRLFGSNGMKVDYKNTRLLLTDVSTIVPAMATTHIEEVIFEAYNYEALNLTSAPTLVGVYEQSVHQREGIVFVVDSGFSFTHVVPFVGGNIVGSGIRRIDVGGKALTNQLKAWLTYKQLKVNEETYIVNDCKEKLCFVSTDIKKDMQRALGSYADESFTMDYVMPDFTNFTDGYVRPHTKENTQAQSLFVGVERFATCELLFRPSTVGMSQMGIAECIADSLKSVCATHKEYYNKSGIEVACIGGNARFDGFLDRLMADLRPIIADDRPINMRRHDEPLTHAWMCGQELVSRNNQIIEDGFVSRAQYNEQGASIAPSILKYFADS